MNPEIPESNLPKPHCKACAAKINEDDFFCQSCGFPIKAPAEERDAFINNRDYKAYELSLMQKQVKSASTSIFVIGVFTALAGIFYYFTLPEEQKPLVTMILNLLIAGIFIALGFWCKEQPVAAIISALSLYTILLILIMINDPMSILKGIIFKIIIIVYLLKGLNSAFESQKIKKTYNL